MITKDLALTEKAEPITPDAVGSWVISSSSYDRVNDRILPPALKSQIGKDVLCLWQHSSDQPIGRWTSLRMKGDKLVADLILAKTNLGMMIRELLAIDTPLGASVGFTGKAKNNEKGGMDFTEISLLETSIVSVPCNAEAMQIAKSFGLPLVIEEKPKAPAIASDSKAAQSIKRANAAVIAAKRTVRKKS